MSIYHKGGEVQEGYHFGGAIQYVYHFGQVVFELIQGFIFTKSGRPLMSKSGRMLCTTKQLKK